jgi:methylthioribose-1-phosphate isomerase
MARLDDGMGTLLKYENVAWYENGAVRILDRRVYPYKKVYVTCRTYEEVAAAIRDMVTQSYGPFAAAAMGMALAAHQCKSQSAEKQADFLGKAAFALSHARPTTSARMQGITANSLTLAKRALDAGEDTVKPLFEAALNLLNDTYATCAEIAKYLAPLFPRKSTIMTQCFADTVIGSLLLECRKLNKQARFICPETRPFLQGSRLTASVISDMGFEVHVITDNMPAYIMGREHVDIFTSAADIITLDGHVVNKVGTFQIALAARYWGVPYYVTGTPDLNHPGMDNVSIEERDESQVTGIMGVRVTEPAVKAYYPAFDVVPPKLVDGVATAKGIFSPYNLASYFS